MTRKPRSCLAGLFLRTIISLSFPAPPRSSINVVDIGAIPASKSQYIDAAVTFAISELHLVPHGRAIHVARLGHRDVTMPRPLCAAERTSIGGCLTTESCHKPTVKNAIQYNLRVHSPPSCSPIGLQTPVITSA